MKSENTYSLFIVAVKSFFALHSTVIKTNENNNCLRKLQEQNERGFYYVMFSCVS